MRENRDYDGLTIIAESVEASKAFSGILIGRSPGNLATSGAYFPRAWFKLKGFAEHSLSDPECKQRTVQWLCDLTVSRDGQDDAEAQLDRLGMVIANTIDGNPIPWGIPGLSMVDSGAYLENEPQPLQSLRITGTFAYLIDPPDSRPADCGPDDSGVNEYFSQGFPSPY